MEARIYKPCEQLCDCIEYFLVLRNGNTIAQYKTFPNTNICLSIYRNNEVNWDVSINTCNITASAKTGASKLFGFHKKPFVVKAHAAIEQVCILFKPEGLSSFTNIPVNQLDLHDHPFEQIFGFNQSIFIYSLFEKDNDQEKIQLLENFLIKQKRPSKGKHAYAMQAYCSLVNYETADSSPVHHIARQLKINESTLYRNFTALFGQSPVQMNKTIRFRRSLSQLLAQQSSLTKLSYNNNFFDQSHCIRDFQQFTGESPRALLKKIAAVQGTMLWLNE